MTDSAATSEVLRRATELCEGDAQRARQWFENEPLPEFRGQTASQAVQQGRAGDVLKLLDIYSAGFLG